MDQIKTSKIQLTLARQKTAVHGAVVSPYGTHFKAVNECLKPQIELSPLYTMFSRIKFNL
jgi:hypothetical protein